MIRIVALTLWAAAAACGRAEGVPDEKLGGLVIETKPREIEIDVARAAKDPAELGRALGRRQTAMIAEIGPHTTSINTSTVVEEAGKVVSTLSDHTTIETGEGDTFHALYSNSADYGREAIYVGGKLYLRPRYQRWHGRDPETRDEPQTLRDQYYGGIAATWDLLGFGGELTDRGTVEIAGRGGRKIEVKLSPTPARPPRETLAQREWREGRSLESLTGEVVLDADTGVPLAVKLDGSIAFTRDGRRFIMKVKLESTISGIGTASPIVAPPAEEVIATPGRLREVDDRDTLLRGIAPPSRQLKGAGPPKAGATPDPEEAP